MSISTKSLVEKHAAYIFAYKAMTSTIEELVKEANLLLKPIWDQHFPTVPYPELDGMAFTSGIMRSDWTCEKITLMPLFHYDKTVAQAFEIQASAAAGMQVLLSDHQF